MDEQAQDDNCGGCNKNAYFANPEGTAATLQRFLAMLFDAERDGENNNDV